MTEVDFSIEEEDTRTYTDRIFFDRIDGENVLRRTVRIDCSDGVPSDLPTDKICLLTNYKANVTRGRKDRLRGQDVVSFPTDKGRIFLPVDEVEKASNMFYSYVTSLKKLLGNKDDQTTGKNS